MKMKKVTISFALLLVFLVGGAVGANASSYYTKITAYLDSSIHLKINGKSFVPVDAKGKELTPITYNGSTYLPLRSVAEAVGLPVQWDGTTKTAALGYSSIQIDNYTSTSYVDIQINGGWHPSYLTPVRQTYSNSFMGVTLETRSSKGLSLDKVVEQNKDEITAFGKIVDTTSIKLDGLEGQLIDFTTNDSHIKRAVLLSDNSDEYYIVEVFIEKSQYEDNKQEIDKILATFRKQM